MFPWIGWSTPCGVIIRRRPPSRLRAYISRLRRALGSAADLELYPPGYRLALGHVTIDAVEFEHLMNAARVAALGGDQARAVREFDAALARWNGDALVEFVNADFAAAPVHRLTELRAAAVEERIEARLRLGHAADVVPELEALVLRQPTRERLTTALLRALYATGRQADALAAYQDLRRRLVDELGVEPDSGTRELYDRILRQDPALTAQPAPGNLPRRIHGFVGRRPDIDGVVRALRTGPLVTATGVGGVGKTRLAIEVAARDRQRFPEGVWRCEFGSLPDDGPVGHAVAAALGVQQRTGLSIEQSVIEYLRSRTALLVLDNCEHVLVPAARLVADILKRCPAVVVLATSRQPLGVEGEQVGPVAPPPVAEATTLFRATSVACRANHGALSLQHGCIRSARSLTDRRRFAERPRDTRGGPPVSIITDPIAVDQAVKAKHRALRALGDYPAVATQVISGLGPVLVAASGVRAGQRVLDVAAGSGNAAIPAALTGADVVACNLTPELLAAGREIAARQGAQLDWAEADSESLPYPDRSFDVVLSCVGAMFVPDHRRSADELLRVCRPGGRIGLISWTPAGFVGEMFRTMKPYAPPPPPGAQPPPRWGDEYYVRGLLGDRVTDVVARRQTVTIDGFRTPRAWREFFKATYGPTIAVYRHIGDDTERAAALDRDLVALAAIPDATRSRRRAYGWLTNHQSAVGHTSGGSTCRSSSGPTSSARGARSVGTGCTRRCAGSRMPSRCASGTVRSSSTRPPRWGSRSRRPTCCAAGGCLPTGSPRRTCASSNSPATTVCRSSTSSATASAARRRPTSCLPSPARAGPTSERGIWPSPRISVNVCRSGRWTTCSRWPRGSTWTSTRRGMLWSRGDSRMRWRRTSWQPSVSG